jgi:hypothetical protein
LLMGRLSWRILTTAGPDMKSPSSSTTKLRGWRHPHPPPEEQFAGRPGQIPSFKLSANNKISPKFNVCRFAHHSDHHGVTPWCFLSLLTKKSAQEWRLQHPRHLLPRKCKKSNFLSPHLTFPAPNHRVIIGRQNTSANMIGVE